MSTTTVRLPNNLKERLAKVAEKRGSTSHALILDAIAERVNAEEKRSEFHTQAEQRFAEIAKNGNTIPWDEMKTYLKARVTEESIQPPKPKVLTR